MVNGKIYFLILFILLSIKVFAQTDSISKSGLNFRGGIGIFAMPGIYAEKNISKEISIEVGLLSWLIYSQGSVDIKFQLLSINNFKLKTGVGYGMEDLILYGNSYLFFPTIPIEIIYKSVSLEIQPGYLNKISRDEQGGIPIIVFLSYIFPKHIKMVK